MAVNADNFSSRVLVYGLGIGANRLLWLIVLPVLSAFFSASDFGRIASLTILALVLRTVFGLGVTTAVGIVYFDSEESEHRDRTIGSALAFVSLSGVALVLVAALASEPLAAKFLDDGTLWFLILVQAIATALQLISEPSMLRLQFDNRAVAYVVISLVVPILGVAVMLTLVAHFELGLLGWAVGQLINGVGQAAIAILVVGRSGLLGRPSFALMRKILRYSLPLLPAVVFVYVLQYGGHFFLKERSTLEILGVYNIGFSLGMAMNLFTNAFNSAWYPHFQSFSQRHGEARKEFSRIASLYLAALCMLVLLAFVLARPAVYLLTDPELYAAYRVVGAIAISQALIGYWTVFLPVLYFTKKVSRVTIFQAVAAAVVSVGCWFAIPSLGAEGAAYALIAGGAVLLALQLTYNSYSKLDVCKYDWRKMSIIFGATITSIFLFRLTEEYTGMWASLAFGCAVICIACVLIWQYYLGDEDKARALASINRRTRA